MAEVLGVSARGEDLASYVEAALARVDAVLAKVRENARPQVYLGRGPEGPETPARGSIDAEIVERVGGANVAVARRAA